MNSKQLTNLINTNLEKHDKSELSSELGFQFHDTLGKSIKKKIDANTAYILGNFIQLKGGLTTGNMEALFISEIEYMAIKSEFLFADTVVKAQTPKDVMNGTYRYMIFLPSGQYQFEELHPMIKEHLLEHKEELENRDKSTIGTEWYSVIHGLNRLEDGWTHGICKSKRDLKMYKLMEDAIPLNADLLHVRLDDDKLWINEYLNCKIIDAIYSKYSSAILMPHDNKPRKQPEELAKIPIPDNIWEHEITNESIIRGFDLTTDEVKYLYSFAK